MPLHRISRRRLTVTILLVVAIVAGFTVRLIDLQVMRSAELTAKSVANRSMELTTYGTRGEIVDGSGVVLADSVDRFDITASPRDVDFAKGTSMMVDGTPTKVSVEQAVTAIARATGGNANDMVAALQDDPEANHAYLAKKVPLSVLDAVRSLEVPWVYDDYRPGRTYPNGAIAGNLVGFIGTDGPQAGLELTADKCLASSNGTSSYERGADNVRIPGTTITATAPKDGGTIHTTIDSDLQWFVQQALTKRAKELGAQWATATVVRVKDAHLLAVADYPTVDPNNVSAAKRTALGSRAFAIPYEPGSTFKPMTVASLLDAGAITPETHIIAPGRYDFPSGDYITDSFAHGDLRLTPAGVLMNSSNTGISVLSEFLPKAQRHDYLVKFGLGKKTEVRFNGESAGSLRDAKDWDPVSSRTIQFGQGVSATSAQIASIYQTLANGGVRTPLVLVEGCEKPDGTMTDTPDTTGTRVVSERAAKQTVKMMETVATQSWLAPLLKIPGYRIATKSGTAEVAHTDGRGYGAGRIVSVAGIAPAEDPQYVVVATFSMADNMSTSGLAASTFQKIMAEVLTRYRVVPSNKPSPSMPTTW